MMIKMSLDVTKVSKDRLFVGKNGKYLNAVLVENKQPDQYGNAGMVIEDVTKEEREAGQRGTIIGNWKYIGQAAPKPAPKPQPKPVAPSPDLDPEEKESLPF